MNTDEDFNIKFVNIIKHHRCLYDKKVPEYRNKDFQEKSWKKISKDTKESVSHCKDRWRNLRACLSRYIKQQSGTDPQHKPYYLTEHMQFLLPFLKPARQATYNSLNMNNNNNMTSMNNIHLLSDTSNSFSNKQIKLQYSPPLDGGDVTIDSFDRQQQQQQINIEQQQRIAAIQQQQQQHLNQPTSIIDLLDDRVNQRQQSQQQQSQQQQSQQNFPNDTKQHFQRIPSPVQSESNTASVDYVPPPEVQIDMSSDDGDPGPLFLSSPHNQNRCFHNTNTNTSNQYYRKRMKFEDHNHNDNTDMDFFRSILPDIENMSFQQRRKFKIGVLELIDEIFTKFPDKTNNINK